MTKAIALLKDADLARPPEVTGLHKPKLAGFD